MKELFAKTSIDFLGNRKWAYLFSTLLTVLCIYAWVSRGDGKYGIDFRGGHELIVQVDNASSDAVRDALSKSGLDDVVVQAFQATSGQFSVRLRGDTSEANKLKETVISALHSKFDGKGTILRSEYIGPAVGKELRYQALIAIALSLIGIVIYVTVRFEFAFAVGALVALLHDVIVATGIYLLVGYDLNMGAVAAALTIVGYSVNDTIVIFDKVREELFKRKNYDLIQVMNESINLMLGRTIITTGLTLFSALALYVLGGGAIADLSLFLVVGIITGCYSTVFIASPIVLAWHASRGGKIKH